MQDYKMPYPGAKSGKSKSAQMERRTSKRKMFVARADVTEFSSNTRISARTMDIGLGGCFIDTKTLFPTDTLVYVKITKGPTEFQAGGTVIYSQEGLGMGIAFSNLDPSQYAILNAWLEGVIEDPVAAPPESSTISHPASSPAVSDRTAMMRLVRLLIVKGLVTEAEGASIIADRSII